jgi:probable F420-dependent oxidoreductase
MVAEGSNSLRPSGVVGAWIGGFGSEASAGELEALGYSALWVPGFYGSEVLQTVDRLLSATTSLKVATSIVSVWAVPATSLAAAWHDLRTRHGRRFIAGVGVSHPVAVESGGQPYGKPLARMSAYLDELDRLPEPLPTSGRVLAALGPRMLQLAGTRAAGAVPFVVTPEHTARAREVLGCEALLAPVQKVLVSKSPLRAREIGRRSLVGLLQLPAYVQNFQRMGFSEEDVRGAGSDRLVDAVVAWGDESACADRVAEHLDAGADHVCLQPLTEHDSGVMEAYRMLARPVTDRFPTPGSGA